MPQVEQSDRRDVCSTRQFGPLRQRQLGGVAIAAASSAVSPGSQMEHFAPKQPNHIANDARRRRSRRARAPAWPRARRPPQTKLQTKLLPARPPEHGRLSTCPPRAAEGGELRRRQSGMGAATAVGGGWRRRRPRRGLPLSPFGERRVCVWGSHPLSHQRCQWRKRRRRHPRPRDGDGGGGGGRQGVAPLSPSPPAGFPARSFLSPPPSPDPSSRWQ